MNFSYENQGTSTFLVYTLSPEETIDTMSLGMLSNNNIPGFARTMFTQMDATKYIKYNVSTKIPVRQFFAGPVNKKRLLGVFMGIISAFESAAEYMIDEKAILLDLDYIFVNVSTCETISICLPVEGASEQKDLSVFFKEIMFSTQFDQSENCSHVAKIINYLNGSAAFTLEGFRELLTQLTQSETAQPETTQSTPEAIRCGVCADTESVTPDKTAQNQPHIPTATPVPPVQTAVKQPVTLPNTGTQQPGQVPTEGKSKSFSLFGIFSKSEKKENKPNSAKQKKTAAKKQVPGIEIPGAQATNLDFDIPGQPAAPKQQPMVPNVSAVNPVTSSKAAAQPFAQSQPDKFQGKQPVVPGGFQQSIPQPVAQPVQQHMKPANFGETTVLASTAGQTTVLNLAMSAEKTDAYLVRQKNGEKIRLDKPVFRIGKEKSYVDYFINDNTAISRSHANIINRDGEYFIVDTNSTNHTYVNGTMINSNEETRLTHGAKIRLANEDFEFRLY